MKRYAVILIFSLSTVFFSCRAQQKKTNEKERYAWGTQSGDGIGKFFMGREIARMMGPGGIDWLERAERDKEENSGLAIENMKLPTETVVADIGAGSGYYSFKIAPILTRGRIYAVEVQDEMIQALTERKKASGVGNVVIVRGGSTRVNLPANSIDLAFMVDVYHELEFPWEIIQSIKEALKPDGRILLIEYRGEDDSIPIKRLHKMTTAQMDAEMKACGLRLYNTGNFLPLQHFREYSKAK